MRRSASAALGALAAAGAGVGAYLGLVTGPRETVFTVIRSPYDERAPRAMQAKVKVLERRADMVLACPRHADPRQVAGHNR